MTYGKTLFSFGLALLAGNFVYEAFGEMRWDQAIEHSWFQAIAIIGAWIVIRLQSARVQGE